MLEMMMKMGRKMIHKLRFSNKVKPTIINETIRRYSKVRSSSVKLDLPPMDTKEYDDNYKQFT